MATLVIKNLTESKELDREAMTRIAGGWAGPRLRIPPYRSAYFHQKPSYDSFKLVDLYLHTALR